MESSPRAGDGYDAELKWLVDQTRGLQPWRRLFHAANGSAIVVALQLGLLGRDQMVLLLAGALLGALAVDVVRLRVPAMQRFFFRSFAALASPREAARIASSTWYVAGCLVALLLFPTPMAEASILVLALGDPSASYVGRRWGKVPLGVRGTVLGTTVFAAVTLCVLLAFYSPAFALLGTLAATAVERTPWGIDDNFTLPVGVGVALALLSRIVTG